ncbi:ABC transporter substrate-binding protein [Pigmentiphaga litoralis]|uniref:Branched-chain amino acid transport system substrate-binding protein n=1 Tax=Pigmentiphaga litoralis TaxID=516702 RepID=A0A7Y9LMJ5_9BURK|nr:ABC transporter substrate-binding protein [Pigmentiphaga litoralis]NYE24635.1 branched-chain amino acid transport system substrate-binding protein [Pigmentiphaga litoralis]NYE81751.1 branched-chain amino acid transport system substrate-binding protein [Pigmentiphaga litoralis]
MTSTPFRRLTCLPAALLTAGVLCGASFAANADTLKIGFLTTLSGPGSVIGNEIRDGFNLGLKHSGGKLGGMDVDMTIVDDHQDPQAARKTVDRLIKRDKVDLITGMAFSNVLLPVLPQILQSGTIYISPNTGPQDYAGEKCDPRFFAAAWQTEDLPAAMGKFANEKGYKKVAIVAPAYPGGRESLNGFKSLYTGTVTDEIYTKLDQLDYSAELARLRSVKPDAVFYFLPGGLGVNFIKQLNAAGLDKQMAILTTGFSADEDVIKSVGAPMTGLFNASQWASDLDNEANKRFVKDFNTTYGRMPTLYASQAYDVARLIDSAAKKTGGKVTDKEAFRVALKSADFASVRGQFAFNTNQFPIQNIYMRQVQALPDGKLGNRLIGTALANHKDAFAAECKMK